MVCLDKIIIGNFYDRAELAKIWGMKGHQGINKGVFTPKNSNEIILFITREQQKSLKLYTNYFDELKNILYIDGEVKHNNDNRIINSIKNNTKIFLFYRNKHHSKFEFKGRVYLSYYEEKNLNQVNLSLQLINIVQGV